MRSTVLKVIIIIAFVGILGIVGIVLINNHNVEKKGYSTIVEQNKSIKMNLLTDRSGLVSTTYGGAADEYAIYTTKSFLYLNEGIDYYFNYFDNMPKMSRADKDKLVDLNAAYIKQCKKAIKSLDVYFTIASKGSAQITPGEKAQLSALSAEFMTEYVNAYDKGTAYFKALQKAVEKSVYKSNYQKDFTSISYEITNFYAQRSISFVKENMAKRISGNTASPLTYSVNVQNFLKMYDKIKANQVITPSNEMSNSTYATFVSNYNKINGLKLLEDPTIYLASLKPETQIVASAVKSFLSSGENYGLSIV